jgi:enoyl-CoA hydratase
VNGVTAGEEEILVAAAGGLGRILINRPQALNALSLENYRRLAPLLAAWAKDPEIHAVMIRGLGGRAFCAGGDIRAIYEAALGIAGDPELPSRFFREEYGVIRQVHRFPKPYIAIIDGITMGGGAGMSVNGSFRIATEKTLFAMPETGIGLFPDVGATRFLNRCPGQIGRYLALTGARLRAADTLYCGFATHFVPGERIEALIRALGEISWEAGAENRQVASLLAGFADDAGPAPLAGLQGAVDRAFARESVEAILAALGREENSRGEFAGWARESRAGLLAHSPTSLKITLRQLEIGRDYGIEEALSLEYRMVRRVLKAHDFYEGVRAIVIDKDYKAAWRPASGRHRAPEANRGASWRDAPGRARPVRVPGGRLSRHRSLPHDRLRPVRESHYQPQARKGRPVDLPGAYGALPVMPVPASIVQDAPHLRFVVRLRQHIVYPYVQGFGPERRVRLRAGDHHFGMVTAVPNQVEHIEPVAIG